MASAKHLPIKIDQEKITAFCRTHGIGRLSLFGSVLRDDFDPVRSDVDVLVDFLPGRTPGWEFFIWHEELEAILGHKVDLLFRTKSVDRPHCPSGDAAAHYEQA